MSELKLPADSGGGSVSLKGPASTTSNADDPFVLPVADGSAGQYLKTDGQKNLSFGTVTIPAGGITEYDRWRLTTGFTGDATPIASNLSRISGNYNLNFPLGTGMSESSGVFTFPSTGWWKISCGFTTRTQNTYASGTAANIMYMQTTEDNGSNWATPTECYSGWNTGEFTQYNGGYGTLTLDITDLSNDKVRFTFDTSNASHGQLCGSNNDQTWFEFMKLADT